MSCSGVAVLRRSGTFVRAQSDPYAIEIVERKSGAKINLGIIA